MSDPHDVADLREDVYYHNNSIHFRENFRIMVESETVSGGEIASCQIIEIKEEGSNLTIYCFGYYSEREIEEWEDTTGDITTFDFSEIKIEKTNDGLIYRSEEYYKLP